MIPPHFFSFVLLVGLFQSKVVMEAVRKIVIHQTTEENIYIEHLRRYARQGDPCGQPQRPVGYTCESAIAGYKKLPSHAKRRCPMPFNRLDYDGGCRTSPSRARYCGLLVAKMDCFRGREVEADFNHCIANLDVDPLHRTLSILTTNKNHKSRVSQTRQENAFLPMLKEFARGVDPCADLEQYPDSNDLIKADAQCLTFVAGYKRLPTEAQHRCQMVRSEGCKREPPPSERWCCGMDMIVKKPGIWGQCRTETVSLAYCIENLSGLVSPPHGK